MNILDEIVASKQIEVAAARQRLPLEDLLARNIAHPVRDFRAALVPHGSIRLIAEVKKKASPSAQVIRPEFDPVAIAAYIRTARCGLPERTHRCSLLPR